LHYYNFF
jgi:hypothetical protein